MNLSTTYPLRPCGGAFIALVGMGMVAGIALRGQSPINGYCVIAGFALAMLSQFFAKRWSTGKPTKRQAFGLIGAIVLESILFIAFANIYPNLLDQNPVRWWLIALILVGVHFLPMALAFGRPAAILGILCIAIASTGLVLPVLPFAAIALFDGALKIGFGGWMFVKR